MGTPPAPPPPKVESLKDNVAGEKPKTIRALMEQHRRNPSCNSCHGMMDPLGFALENFDAVGQYRTLDRDARSVDRRQRCTARWHAGARSGGFASRDLVAS